MVRAGTEVFKLVIERTLKLRLSVPERYGLEVSGGQAVEVHTAVSAKPIMGTVARISPWVDPTTRAFEVEVHVPNLKGELKTGGFAKAYILVRVDANAVTVPLTALHSFAGTTRVYLLENGKVKDVPVTVGVQSAEWAEISSPPLLKGAQVVTSGHSVLADGTAVTVRGEKK
jgi:RND family efflux transporter MFP subunit